MTSTKKKSAQKSIKSSPARKQPGFLQNARVYLSGPMDFVHCRKEEKKWGWRVRVGQFLADLGATVFDPWSKPSVLGMYGYGREGEKSARLRETWTFEQSPEGQAVRKQCCQRFREIMHLDLRMVDISDFVIACSPTNIYSVGTPHEIIVATQQHKPVLFVSPPVTFTALDHLRKHLTDRQDRKALKYLADLERQVPIKTNPRGVPSLWYMPLIGSENFFDGFGFARYRERFRWVPDPADRLEEKRPPKRPLLPFLEELHQSGKAPEKWDPVAGKMTPDDDWLLLDLARQNQP